MYTMVIATFYRDATSHNHQVNSKTSNKNMILV